MENILNTKDLVKVDNKFEFQKTLESELGCRVKSYPVVNINLDRNKVEVIAMVDVYCSKIHSFAPSKSQLVNLFEIEKTKDNKSLKAENL